jgi:hypothetical protein
MKKTRVNLTQSHNSMIAGVVGRQQVDGAEMQSRAGSSGRRLRDSNEVWRVIEMETVTVVMIVG